MSSNTTTNQTVRKSSRTRSDDALTIKPENSHAEISLDPVDSPNQDPGESKFGVWVHKTRSSMAESMAGLQKPGGSVPLAELSKKMGARLANRDSPNAGFVPVSPGRPKAVHNILPRSVIGICLLLLAFGVGSAFSGAAFYAYYDDRLSHNEQVVASFVDGFDQQFNDAASAIEDVRIQSIDEIRHELRSLEGYVEEGKGIIDLPQSAGPSVWLLETLGEDGELKIGSACAVVGHEGGTGFITSYSLVAASAVAPAPGLDLVKAGKRVPAQLWAWDVERDLALVVIEEVVPVLPLADKSQQVDSLGRRVFAMSGAGGQGSTAAPGVLIDSSEVGLQHTAPSGSLFDGGPLLNGHGHVIGMATSRYQPLGFDIGEIGQAPDVRGFCATILLCADDLSEVDLRNGESDAPIRGDSNPVREPSLLANTDEEISED